MAQKTLTVRIIQRNDTLANWNANNPVLLKGEVGMITDATPKRFKIGDGTTSWDLLPTYSYISSDDADALDILAQMLSDDDFGKVDDVTVDDVSVVDNKKVAKIVMATISYSDDAQEVADDKVSKSKIVLHKIAKTGNYNDLSNKLVSVDNLDSQDTRNPLSANQGRVLKNLAQGASVGHSYSTIQALVTALNGYNSDELKVGGSLYVQSLNVPDFWVYSIESVSVPYSYTTDQALIDIINASGSVQIGYYRISKLETEKVDLTNYATKDFVNNLISELTDEIEDINLSVASLTGLIADIQQKDAEQDSDISGLKSRLQTIESDDTILRSTDTFILNGGNSVV